MEKIEIVFSKPPITVIDFDNKKIEIENYIPLSVRTKLSQWYVASILDAERDLADRFFNAEMTLVLGIVDECTNLAIIREGEYLIDIDGLIGSDLWNLIKNNISNYKDFRRDLARIVDMAIENEHVQKSVGSVIDALASKGFELLGKVSETDLSEEGVAKLLKNFDSVINNFNDKYVSPKRDTESKPSLE